MLIDNLNSGGAQRQLVMLALLLADQGHQIDVVRYYPNDFFADRLEHPNIKLRLVSSSNFLSRIFRVRHSVRSAKPDVVISFLKTPMILAELTAIWRKNFCLVVSERSLTIEKVDFRERCRLRLHSMADFVVPNSVSQANYLAESAPYLQNKIRVIHNCVDLQEFSPAPDQEQSEDQNNILLVGRIRPEKNPFGLLSAIEIIRQQEPSLNVGVDWYGSDFYIDGKPTAHSSTYEELRKEIEKKGLEDVFRLRKPLRDVRSLYRRAPVVCLPSFYEGFSNVLCEAAACGRPLLASNVSDNGIIVKHGVNGFLFDPKDPQNIAEVIKTFFGLSVAQRATMGKASRAFAEQHLSPARFVEQYLQLVEEHKITHQQHSS